MAVAENKQVKFYLDADLVQFVESECTRRGCSLSHLANEALRQRMGRVLYRRKQRIANVVEVKEGSRRKAGRV